MEYRGIHRRRAIGLIAIVLMSAFLIVWWLNRSPMNTGNTVPVTVHPYHQLAYTKLANQSGNFVGDVFLLDIDSGDITQLTQGGETGAVSWLNSEILSVYQRPIGSVINYFHLNVNQGSIRETENFAAEIHSINRSPNQQRLVTELITSNTSESEGYAVIEIVAGQAQTLFNLPDASGLPEWLPNSETILYDTQNGEVCLHHIDSDTRDCLFGTQVRLSPTITPLLAAYTTSLNNIHQLCVAHIEQHSFSHTQCYDQNEAQIVSLHWRP